MPARVDPTTAPATTPNGVSQGNLHSPPLQPTSASVLIVEDEDTSRLVLAELIQALDPTLETKTCSDAREALDWLRGRSPDLLITDYRMPGMTGAELIREMRSNPMHFYVPAMVITASEDRAVRYESLEAGAVDFLTKPLDPIEVRTRCRNWLTLSQQYRQLKTYAELQEAQLRRLRGTVEDMAPEAVTCSNVTPLDGTVTVSYGQLFEVTSALSAFEQLAQYGAQLVENLERDLHRPLRRRLS